MLGNKGARRFLLKAIIDQKMGVPFKSKELIKNKYMMQNFT